jgi:CheY-like chemotaxis protein
MTDILVVEDHQDTAEMLSILLKAVGKSIVVANSLSEGMEVIGKEIVRCALIDRSLPDGDGLKLIPTLREHQPHCYVIVCTGLPDNPPARSDRSDPFAPDDYLRKPIKTVKVILDLIDTHLVQDSDADMQSKTTE